MEDKRVEDLEVGDQIVHHGKTVTIVKIKENPETRRLTVVGDYRDGKPRSLYLDREEN